MTRLDLLKDLETVSQKDSLAGDWIAWLSEAEYSPNFEPYSDFKERPIIDSNRSQRALRLFFRSGSLPPEIATNGFCTAIFDGDLDNIIELSGYGEEFSKSQSSNSEIILQAYLKFGDEFLNKIRGVYSLIIWDSNKNLLLAARDRLGIRSLFYTQQKKGTLFSPSIDPLLAERN